MTKFILNVLVLLFGGLGWLYFGVSSSSTIEWQATALGRSSQLALTLQNPNGVREIRAELAQGQARAESVQRYESRRWFLRQGSLDAQTVHLGIEADPGQGFRSGPARLTLTAVSNDLRGRSVNRGFDVQIVLEPPRLEVDGAQHYINQGGAELVTFRVKGAWQEAGVRVGAYRFRSFPLPGAASKDERFCLFAFPYDVSAKEVPLVYARDAAGQEVTAGFWFKLFPKTWRRRKLELSDEFLEKVTSSLAPGSGELLPRFLAINRDMRKANNQALADLRLHTEEKILWTSPFEQLSNSKVEALFADYREYIYRAQKVDEQVHLGFDLSKTAAAPVVAANSGRVVFAGPLGIYGNCVVIDHGYALQSIYAHLSSISVKVDDRVERRQEIGRSGATGLAGGDHLHFSMQIDGVQVNPLEWWDAHWIQDRIAARLPAGTITPARRTE